MKWWHVALIAFGTMIVAEVTGLAGMVRTAVGKLIPKIG